MLMPAGNAGCVLHETPEVPLLPEPPLLEPPVPEPPPLLDELVTGKGGLKIPNDWAPFPLDSLTGIYNTPFTSTQ